MLLFAVFSWGEVEDWGRPVPFPKRAWVWVLDDSGGEGEVQVTLAGGIQGLHCDSYCANVKKYYLDMTD